MSTSPDPVAAITGARIALHAALLASGVLSIDESGWASIADNGNATSRLIACSIIQRLQGEVRSHRLIAQTLGKEFEDGVRDYLNDLMPSFGAVARGRYSAARNTPISAFAQYRHMKVLEELAAERREVRIALGGDYIVVPDVVVARAPMSDEDLNHEGLLVDGVVGARAALRNQERPILHASISCKSTIRSDRSQNSRLEALNLIRNRRGRAPHIVVVTAEPMPTRIASIAVGTGDFDCIYHIALPELEAAAAEVLELARAERRRPDRPTATETARVEQLDRLNLMIESGRLKDIADLPLDLAL